ncbi:MAG TPA: polymer-forming cytoskeletal protein [Nevskiaceae bacterium]|nr:polymer-forming cytoskeletal protein [Nevskiaceae bacterium]
MDPSALQSDTDNDVHSLEGNPEVVTPDTSNQNKPAPGTPSIAELGQQLEGAGNGSAPPPKKQSFIKKILGIWRKFNIYLLLLILLMLLAGGSAVVLYLNNRKQATTTQNDTSSQSLSDSTLKQLANSDVTVGNPKQILNVESNAVFAGAVLVQDNLEVAGSIKVGNSLSLPGITVSGTSNFGQVQATSIAVAGTASVQGVLTARNGLAVTGTSTFNGNVSASQISTNTLQLNGNLAVTKHITAGGPVPSLAKGSALGSGGTASVSGSDTAGSITINTGSNAAAGCFATITFATVFNTTPHIAVTPIGASAADLSYYVNRSTTSFSVCTASPPTSGATFGFDYIALD